MKNIVDHLNEALANDNAMFMGKTSRRTQDDFNFNPGEKVILIKYGTDGYEAQLRGIFNIDKVNRNSIKIKGEGSVTDKKFNKYGICIEKHKNSYRGNRTNYWVLYNKELTNEEELEQLINNGTCSWGFKVNQNKPEFTKELQKCINEL